MSMIQQILNFFLWILILISDFTLLMLVLLISRDRELQAPETFNTICTFYVIKKKSFHLFST